MPPALNATTPMDSLIHLALQKDFAKRFARSQMEHQKIHASHEGAKVKAEVPRMGMDLTATQ